MKKYAIIGYPLGHSLSPNIHERLFKLSGIEAEYVKMEIPPDELQNKYEELSELDGFNITIPHKIPIIDYCNKLSTGAQNYGSVNCIRNEGDVRFGFNTDILGFRKSIDLLGANLSSRVLLIGCGGVGRMMALETALYDGELTIAVLKRNLETAQEVVSEIKRMNPDARVHIVCINGKAVSASDFDGMPVFDLIMNASPVGMFPDVDSMPCDENLLYGASYVFDVVYNPRDTLLVKTAGKLGIKAMSGMAMLVFQAVVAHGIWNDSKFDNADIKALISDMEALV